jgi:peptidoglycan/xylan/chitin deacetylase (PgdA/CDA1 family)
LFVKTPKFIRNFFPSIIWRKEIPEEKIWITFDDGPSPDVTPFILNTLKEEKVKATFFLVGEQIEKYPELFDLIVLDGHKVANHSYSHKKGWQTNNSTYFEDIEKCQNLLSENKLFRPPYGQITPLQIKYLKEKYKIILWDVLSWDFCADTNSNKIKENVLKNTESGSIIVFHNNQKSFKNLKLILKETIHELKKRSFSFSNTW